MAQTPLNHTPLFNARLLDKALSNDPAPALHQQLLDDWASAIQSGAIRQRSERQIRGSFIQKFFCDFLGYTSFGSDGDFTVTEEARTGTGSADVALGRFGLAGNQVVAPVELKGADTPNLDLSMPGRYKSPVQQVWEYARDIKGARFMVLSNMLEIRLYAVGHTRQIYERFDLLEVAANPREYRKLLLLLSCDQLLSGRTQQLLDESAQAEREITRALYADYKRWRIQLIVALAHANDLLPGALIAPAQKLLDRVLFVAFAQQRGLLPVNTLKDVHATTNAWVPVPKYDNYKGLFRAVDKGLPSRNIPPYNGGLFAMDALLDQQLAVPNSACDIFLEFGKYDFGGEVSVNVLGHIFEQSISDIEELQQLADTGAFTLEAAVAQVQSTTRSVSGARKQLGIVYTPEFITSFIVEQTLGRTLDERRTACQAEHLQRKPTADEKKYAKSLAQPERVVELAFWRAWLAEFVTIKVCDPACGSGAFLVAAFDSLLAEYTNVNEQIAAISGSMEVFNADREILNSNLFGVDLNAESIEITKLSLWLKTAKYGKPLEGLEANLQVGNSIISSADGGQDFDTKAFDWTQAFPDIVARGGFDVVIGNPPYVRMERLKTFKPYLEKRYAVAAERADLYCYFFELGIRLLRNGHVGGRIGFISSSTFFKTGSGENLRRYLLANAQIEALVDFGDVQIFEGVTTYPAIVVAKRSGAPRGGAFVRFFNVGSEVPEDLRKTFKEHAQTTPQSNLTAANWQFESDAHVLMHKKLTEGYRTLKEVYGAPLYGIKTGLNEAFVINRAQRDALIKADYRSAELLKPFLEGKDLKTWRVEPQDHWLIYIPKSRIAIDHYPAIKAYLLPFKQQLEQRATKQAWFELQQAQEAYAPHMTTPKVVYGHFSPRPLFSFDSQGYFSNDKSYIIPTSDRHLTALLNSKLIWWKLCQLSPAVRGGFHEVRVQYVEQLPVPTMSTTQRDTLSTLAVTAQTAAEARHTEIKRFAYLVQSDLVPGGQGGGAKLPTAWQTEVPSFDGLRDELKKRFKRELPLGERNVWDCAVSCARQEVASYTQTIAQCEREINALVYQLFDLSADEIALIEAV